MERRFAREKGAGMASIATSIAEQQWMLRAQFGESA
jgi:hypothetical protein